MGMLMLETCRERRKMLGLTTYQYACGRITWVITDLRTHILNISHAKMPCGSLSLRAISPHSLP